MIQLHLHHPSPATIQILIVMLLTTKNKHADPKASQALFSQALSADRIHPQTVRLSNAGGSATRNLHCFQKRPLPRGYGEWWVKGSGLPVYLIPRPSAAGRLQRWEGSRDRGTGRERRHQGGCSAPLSAASNHSGTQKASRLRWQLPTPRTGVPAEPPLSPQPPQAGWHAPQAEKATWPMCTRGLKIFPFTMIKSLPRNP